MSIPQTNREPMLKRAPTPLQPLIEQRLVRWDELSGEKQKELLENETALRHFAEFSTFTPKQQQEALTNMPAAQRQALEAAVAKWQNLGEDRRQEVAQRFEEYFGLRPEERARTLRTFSEADRHQMERALQFFGKLDSAKRARCVQALEKLTQFTPEEREEFLRNAERWQALSPAERKSWRALVMTLSLPPMPKAPLPPLPPARRGKAPSPTMATNQ